MTEDEAARRAGNRASWSAIACLAIFTPGVASTVETLRGLGEAALKGEKPVEGKVGPAQVGKELGEWFCQQVVLAVVFKTTLPVLLFAELLNRTVEWLLNPQRPEAVQREVDKLGAEERKKYELLEERVRQEAAKPMAERDDDIINVVDEFISAWKQWDHAQREARDAERERWDQQASRGRADEPRPSGPAPAPPESPSRTPEPADLHRGHAPSAPRRQADTPARRRRRSRLGYSADREPDAHERDDQPAPTRDTAPEPPLTAPASPPAASRPGAEHDAREAWPIPLPQEDLERIDPAPQRDDERPGRGSRDLDR